MTGTDTTHRIVDPSQSVTSGVQPLGTAVDRSLHHIQRQEVPAVHISIPRSMGGLCQSSVNPVKMDGHGVRLPSVQNHPNSDNRTQTVKSQSP